MTPWEGSPLAWQPSWSRVKRSIHYRASSNHLFLPATQHQIDLINVGPSTQPTAGTTTTPLPEYHLTQSSPNRINRHLILRLNNLKQFTGPDCNNKGQEFSMISATPAECHLHHQNKIQLHRIQHKLQLKHKQHQQQQQQQ